MDRTRYFRLLLCFECHAVDPVLYHCERCTKVCPLKMGRGDSIKHEQIHFLIDFAFSLKRIDFKKKLKPNASQLMFKYKKIFSWHLLEIGWIGKTFANEEEKNKQFPQLIAIFTVELFSFEVSVSWFRVFPWKNKFSLENKLLHKTPNCIQII